MGVPKRKRSRTRRDKRFANKGIETKVFGSCSNCQEVLMSHTACSNCGFFKGKKLFKTKLDRAGVRADANEKRKARMASAPQEPQE